MTQNSRLRELEQAIGSAEPTTIRLLYVPADRWSGEPPLSAAEVEAYTERVYVVPGRAA
jgi:hypothetical protein